MLVCNLMLSPKKNDTLLRTRINNTIDYVL